jgi:MscS family membrane protein
LGIRYDTPPELIEEFVEGVKKIIELHPTTRNYSNYTPYNSVPYNVEFIDYGDSSLNILLNVYFMTNDYAKEMHGRHILLLGILELANGLGVEFAFPSQTLFMELFPEKKPAYPQYNTDKDFIRKTMAEILEEFKTKIAKY